ncbi:MAG: D-tyrosyl-tRNA(Tyr) deacylase [Kiritimatiellia bacterium]
MRLVIQRVESASVKVGDAVVGQIDRGFLILVGITHGDTRENASWLARKTAGLRIFDDPDGKMNLSLADVNGSCLAISQFTLYGDCRKGNRPSYIASARPEEAEPLYEAYIHELRARGFRVETGIFGADMRVSLVNDGPVTLQLDSHAH